ncbi:MAG: mRNA surveillance protein pelota [Desulfurococcaceae archaeon]
MRIMEEDYKRGWVKLQVETLDDLWVLYNVLRENDTVYAKTTREVKVGDGSPGSRVPMVLGLKVKNVEFQQFSSKLRVKGVVVEGPEEYGVKGKHHTFSVGVGDVITVVKERWDEHELEFIRKHAVRRGSVLILSIDFDEACLGVLSEQGVRHVWEGTLNLPSKLYHVDYEKLLRDFITEVAKIVLEIAKREDVKAILISGPGEIKNYVKTELADKTELPVYSDSTSTGGCQGLNETLKRDTIKRVIGELGVLKARSNLEEFKELLVKDHDMVSYGLREVFDASLMGAVKSLVVVDGLLRTPSDEERNMLFEALRQAHQHGAEVVIVPGKSDVGLELEGFGGVVAILRFKLHKTRVDLTE